MKFFKITCVSLLVFALSFTTSFAKSPEKAPKTITVIGTTDIHGNIWGYSYEDNKETTNNGIARVYSYIESVRKENPGNVVLIDDGDTFQGTILTDDIYNKQDGKHPMVSVLNFMKYDAMALGNHEFNFGLDLIKRIQKQAKFPILGANVRYKDGKEFAKAYTIIKRGGVKIGIIGLTNPDVPRWDGEKVSALQFESVADGAKAAYDKIKNKCDFVIGVAHVGFFPEYDEDHGTDAGETILKACPEIKVLMLGHAHVTINERVGDAQVLGCKNSGREVARFDVTLDEHKKVKNVVGTIIDMKDYEPSQTIRNLPEIKEAHEKTIAFVTGGTVNSDGTVSGGVFGTAARDFQPQNEIKGIPEGKLRDTAVLDLINKVQLVNSGADVSASALFKDTSDLKAGPINYGNIFDIYKFDNTLYRVEVTGAELKRYMEWSAACYNQWKSGDISISFNPEKPGYLYDMFAGIDYQIDLSKPAGQRIVNVVFKGKPLEDDQRLQLAVNNYRYSSALRTQKLVEGKRNWESPLSIRDMLVAYIKEHGTIEPEVDNNWSIVGVDLNSPYRDTIIKMVNDGELEVPYAKSLNVNELKEQGIIK